MGAGRNIAALAGLCLLAACAPRERPHWTPFAQPRNENWHPAATLLLRYDSDNDGAVTRRELEAGLRQDFRQADTNHNGTLDADEVRAVNQRRVSQDQSMATPLIDWNLDGVVDFDEFAGTMRSLFDQLDQNGDGVVSKEEFKAAQPRLYLAPAG
jgi:Ca2+-binding EF-hand superfamily protein